MQAVMYDHFGDESVLSMREVPVPQPGSGQVQVRVNVASLNPVDFKLRSGILRIVGRPKRPAITGKDFAGVITALGANVHGYAIGQRVFGSVDPLGGDGSCAQFVALSTDLIAPIPESLSDEVAASLPVASGTALEALADIAQLKRGQSVLITGASGAVGASAVQLARSIGARTLLWYGDGITGGPSTHEQMAGICLIDEIDAHMHVDLQHRALPKLMQMFPRVQFIVSSHSPLFVLGVEKAYGENKVAVIEMPLGLPIQAEAYAEFGRALEIFQDSNALNQAMLHAAESPGKLLVLLEGETDPMYLMAAAELLGRSSLLDRVEFAWVGAKDPKNGQGFHTGKDALNATASVLRAKPELIKRPVLLLYDNDASKTAADYANLHIRPLPTNPTNTAVEDGIENLLPAHLLTEEMFNVETKKKRNGNITTIKSLNKMKLCKSVCESKRDPSDFTEFGQVLEIAETIAKLHGLE